MSGLFSNTKSNILRNKWLSLATVLVATIVFLTASFFIALSMIAQRAVTISQTKAQLQIYFQVDTPEEEISKVRRMLESSEGIENINYIDQEEALQLYLEYYSDDPDLIDSVSADWLPPSLEVRAVSLDYLEGITDQVQKEKDVNPYIEEVVYHEDVVNQLKSLATGIRYGAIAIITIFSIITVSLVYITIAFNINSHKKEIEIMHLIGSSDFYIKTPFIVEGTFYTTLGAFLAATLILVPWYILTQQGNDSNIQFILTELTQELKLDYLIDFNVTFILIYYSVHLFIGAAIGFISSSLAVMKYLKLNDKK